MRSINDSFRYHAAMSAVASWGEVFQERDVWRWEQDPMDSFRSFARVAREYEAVVCPNDAIAIYLVNYLKQQGITVPDDLFVASFGNMAIGRYHRPSITSMTMDMQYVGKQAFSVWRHLMKSEQSMQRIALRITVPSKILIRESTAHMPLQSGVCAVFPSHQDSFYHQPAISRLVRLEKCISQRDETDMQILRLLMAKKAMRRSPMRCLSATAPFGIASTRFMPMRVQREGAALRLWFRKAWARAIPSIKQNKPQSWQRASTL